MSDDRNIDDIPPMLAGFEEPEAEQTPRRQIGLGGHASQEAAAQEAPRDALDRLLERPDLNDVTRLIAHRLRDIEKHFPDAFKVGQSIVAIIGRLNQLEPVVQHLSQQRAIAEVAMERQVRAVALDMAIKALPDGNRGDPVMISQLADAFLVWLKSGTQG